jgi:beta-lactamase class A
MCSTFKWVLAAAVLGHVESRTLTLQHRLSYGEADLLEYAPVTREHARDGFMTVEALMEAAVTVSDNTAANLLLREIGGPMGLTQFIRANGDSVTRLDRNEPLLNVNEPGDLRDTTSPRAMVGLMRHILCGQALSEEHRALLIGWMRACETGRRRLRAGFPADWIVGDKTGTGLRNAVNDVAIAVPPGRAPILVTAYLSGGTAAIDASQAALAKVASVVARDL